MRRTIALLTTCAATALAPTAPAVANAAPVTAVANATPVAAVANAAPGAATRIVLERTGGFAGVDDVFAVSRSTESARRALRMAASPEFLRLRASYQPANPCCDRFAYRLTVTYRNAHHKTVSTVQGAAAPHILWTVIAEVQRAGAARHGLPR